MANTKVLLDWMKEFVTCLYIATRVVNKRWRVCKNCDEIGIIKMIYRPFERQHRDGQRDEPKKSQRGHYLRNK